MKLDEYLWRKKIKQADFAEKVGITRTWLGLVLRGQKKPGRFLAEKIELATGGQVKVEDLIS